MPHTDNACGWCGRPQNEVKKLLPSPLQSSLMICDRCVGQCAALLATQPKSKEAQKIPTPWELYHKLDEYIVGQDMAKKIAATAVYKHYKRREAHTSTEDDEFEKDNVIISGPSGVGKTAILRVLAKILNVPFYVQDATKLTQTGYVGDDIEMMLQGLLEQCGWDVKAAQWGIVGIDEVDKLGRKSGREVSGYRDVNGEGVQQALLKVVEGGEHVIPMGLGARLTDPNQRTVVLDTTNILFFGLGSFAGIEKIIERRLNKSAGLGFGRPPTEKVSVTNAMTALDEEDLLEFGLIPEFAGRFSMLAGVLPLTEDQLVSILTKPKKAFVKQQRAYYARHNVDLEFTPEALKAIAKKASEKETGARALKKILAGVMLPYDLDTPSDPTIRKITITEQVVLGLENAQILRDPGVKLAEA